jgi:predicted nuclease with TOPRIM domain
MASQFKSLLEDTEETLERFKKRAVALREEHDDRRAATKVQIKAMVQRLENKYEEGQKRLEELRDEGSDSVDELRRFNRGLVSDLQDMARTIRRRIR